MENASPISADSAGYKAPAAYQGGRGSWADRRHDAARKVGRDRFSTPSEKGVEILKADNDYMFGASSIGQVDNGLSVKHEFGRDNTLLPGAARLDPDTHEMTTFTGAPGSNPAFPVGTEPAKVTMSDQLYKREQAMRGLMQPPATNAPLSNLKANDTRIKESDPRVHKTEDGQPPVKISFDPSIIMDENSRKEVADRLAADAATKKASRKKKSV